MRTRNTTPICLALLTGALCLSASRALAEAGPGDLNAPGLNVATGGSASASPTLLNPAISLDGLFTYSQFNKSSPLHFEGGHDPSHNGFNIQQVELGLSANIDPYFRGDAFLVLTAEGTIEIEETYLTTLALPGNLQLKAGQFLTAFGRSNPTHPHTWYFDDKPLIMGRVFGGDGLRGPGAQLSWLTPLPWFSELLVSAQQSDTDTDPSFLGYVPAGTEQVRMRTLADAVWLGRTNNFVTLSDSLLLNLGASCLWGRNPSTDTSHTRITGGDVYLKYRQPEGLSFIGLQAEILTRSYDLAQGGPTNDWGWYAELVYRLPNGWERWIAGLRYDWVSSTANPVQTSELGGGGIGSSPTPAGPNPDLGTRWRVSPGLTFYPSEFSKVRFQYNYDHAPVFANAQQVVSVEWEFVMGAHGAHKF